MSERWQDHTYTRTLVSPVGQFCIWRSNNDFRLVDETDWVIAELAAKDWDTACLEAERIIAERCRETLKLLGESE